MDSPSTDQPRELQASLLKLRQESLLAQIELLARAFPAVWADAERFVSETKYQPWEFGVAFSEGELKRIQERYGVEPSRRRPASEHVSPLTDIFYEACSLVAQKLGLPYPGL